MDCKGCRQKLSSYLEGEMSTSEQQGVAAHLASCPSCAAELAALKQTLSDLKKLPQVPVPAEFRQAVWKKIEAPGLQSRLREWLLDPWYLKLPVEALAAAAVVLLVVQVSRVTAPQLAKQEAESDRMEEQQFSRKDLLREKKALESSRRADLSQAPREQMEIAKEAKPKAAVPPKPESAVLGGFAGREIPAQNPPLHVRLHVLQLEKAKEELNRFFSENYGFHGLKVVAANRYYVVLTPQQLKSFLDRLSLIGELDAVKTSDPVPADLSPGGWTMVQKEEAADFEWVVLDLVPI